MCGIFGVWNRNRKPIDLRAVQRGVQLLAHRGPDDEGYLLGRTASSELIAAGGADTATSLRLPRIEAVAGEFNLALGFRRLSILDLSAAGHQPMSDRERHSWIVFNGEIYNYRELRAELQQRGRTFQTGTDTEVVLAAFAEWGVQSLSRFNGMWAIALWDTPTRRLILARDRFGVKPLFLRCAGDQIAFASEAKALIGPGLGEFRANESAVFDFLVHNRLPDPRTGESFFDDIQSLPPGFLLEVTETDVVRRRFYELPIAERDPTTPIDDRVRQFQSLLHDAIDLRLNADVTVGTCLSGGLDSSSIVAVATGLLDRTRSVERPALRTVSAVYDERASYNERSFVDTVLRATGARGVFVVPTIERLRNEFDALVWHQDEPFGTASIFAQWCVMSAAREAGITVLLDGQGADEILVGYRPMLPVYLASRFARGQAWDAVSEAWRIAGITGMNVGSLLATALFWLLPKTVQTHARRRRRVREKTALRSDFAARFADRTSNYGERRQFDLYLKERCEESLPHLLRYEDRNSMAFQIEARVPFLDFRFVEFTFADARDMRVRDGWTKWALREAMRDTLPSEIAWRRDKVGFDTPESAWLRDWLVADRDRWLADVAQCPYVRFDRVRQLIDAYGQTPDDGFLWRVLCLARWLRVWNDFAATGVGPSGARGIRRRASEGAKSRLPAARVL